jgi:hypothetical protein
MQFSSKEDIEAPISNVFAMLAEFEAYERSAIRRGIEVQRVDPNAPVGVGLAWDTQFAMRGKRRNMRLNLVEYDPANTLRVAALSQGMEGEMKLDLMALSAGRTRLTVTLDLTPRTLSSRLLVQSLKLAKSNLTKRFKLKVADYAKNMEDRHKRIS